MGNAATAHHSPVPAHAPSVVIRIGMAAASPGSGGAHSTSPRPARIDGPSRRPWRVAHDRTHTSALTSPDTVTIMPDVADPRSPLASGVCHVSEPHTKSPIGEPGAHPGRYARPQRMGCPATGSSSSGVGAWLTQQPATWSWISRMPAEASGS